MNRHETSTGAPEGATFPDLLTVADLVNRADSLVELINMAAEAGTITGQAGQAINWGCVHIHEVLGQVREILTGGLHGSAVAI